MKNKLVCKWVLCDVYQVHGVSREKAIWQTLCQSTHSVDGFSWVRFKCRMHRYGSELRITGNIYEGKLIWSITCSMGISFLCATFQAPSTLPQGSFDDFIDNYVIVN